MGKAIIVCSAKGGVGKTTTTINLGAALAERGKSVVVVDGSLTTPDIGLHVAIPFYIRTLNDVAENNALLNEAQYTHRSGLKIVPASVTMSKSLADLGDFEVKTIFDSLKKDNDFVLVDSAAGLDFTSIGVIHSADELLAVVNPEIAAVVNTFKSIAEGKSQGIPTTGLIINKHQSFKNALHDDEVLSVIGREIPILGKIPHDRAVLESQRSSEPVITHAPHSRASREFKRIAAILAGERYERPAQSFLEKVKDLFRN
jgi:septum site-determining protein MinD